MLIRDLSPKSVLRYWRREEENKVGWMSHWDDLTRVQLPGRQGFVTQKTPGERWTDDIYDGSPMRAAIMLANALGNMMRPAGEQWIFMQTEKTDEEGELWLQDSAKRMIRAFDTPKSRGRQACGEVDLDLVVLGTGCLFVGEGKSLSHLLFQSNHLRDVTVMFNDEGYPDGMFIRREYTLRNAIDKFKEENLAPVTREKIRGAQYQTDILSDKIKVLHAVLPRYGGRYDALLNRAFPYADLWIEIEAEHEISQGGFRTFPFIVPRWDTTTGETYGRSPGMVALPDSDTLQAQGETILISGQRTADPAMAVPDDGTYNEMNTFPGGMAYYNLETAVALRGNPFFPLTTGANLPITLEMQQDTRDQVYAAFYKNVLNLPVAGPQMTATEVMARKEEFIREMGPVYGRIETDYLAVKAERMFNVLLHANAFAPIPESLQNKRVTFEFESPIKKVKQQVEAAAARLWVEEMLVIGQTLPEAKLLVNVEGYGRFAHKAAHLPPEIILSTEQYQDLKDQQQQEMDAAAQMEMVQQGAIAADKGASAFQRAAEIQQPGKGAR